MEERKKKVKTYMDYFENKYGVKKISFEEFPKDLANEFEEYVKSLEEIHQKLKDATKKSDILHESLMEYINRKM